MLRAAKFIQDKLLVVKTKKTTDTPVMITTFNPSNPDIKKFITKNWNIIERNNDCAHTFPSKPIVGFRKLPNLREMLTKASISYPPQPKAPAKLISSVCTRLGKCTYCPLIHKISPVKCKITNKLYQSLNFQSLLHVN